MKRKFRFYKKRVTFKRYAKSLFGVRFITRYSLNKQFYCFYNLEKAIYLYYTDCDKEPIFWAIYSQNNSNIICRKTWGCLNVNSHKFDCDFSSPIDVLNTFFKYYKNKDLF